jgi:hypothetical protein
MATAGLAAHVIFELGAGVGMPGASILGPLPGACRGRSAPGRPGAAETRPAPDDTAFAICNIVGLAAVVARFTGWPRRRTGVGLPWLRECEGLGPALMPS